MTDRRHQGSSSSSHHLQIITSLACGINTSIIVTAPSSPSSAEESVQPLPASLRCQDSSSGSSSGRRLVPALLFRAAATGLQWFPVRGREWLFRASRKLRLFENRARVSCSSQVATSGTVAHFGHRMSGRYAALEILIWHPYYLEIYPLLTEIPTRPGDIISKYLTVDFVINGFSINSYIL